MLKMAGQPQSSWRVPGLLVLPRRWPTRFFPEPPPKCRVVLLVAGKPKGSGLFPRRPLPKNMFFASSGFRGSRFHRFHFLPLVRKTTRVRRGRARSLQVLRGGRVLLRGSEVPEECAQAAAGASRRWSKNRCSIFFGAPTDPKPSVSDLVSWWLPAIRFLSFLKPVSV